MGMYTDKAGKVSDIITANASTLIRWVPSKRGGYTLRKLSEYERYMANEERASAIVGSRLIKLYTAISS